MSIQPLIAQDQQNMLQFHDSTGCAKWIESLPLTNVRETQQVLAAQLALLRAERLQSVEHLKILEVLKEPIAFVQSEAAKRHTGKALPLEASQATEWNNTVDLWREIDRNYQQCLQAYRDGDVSVAPYAALVCLRCLNCLRQAFYEYYRVYRQVAAVMWRELHELYDFAEQHGFARSRVTDVFVGHDPDSSCAESYIHTLLAHLANPYSLSARQLGLTQRWLEKWAPLVGLSAQPLPASPIPSLAVDLCSDAGLTFADKLESESPLRYFDLEQLSKTLRQTINLLKQGQTPGQLGLGGDARQPGCENLMMLLYVQWCRAGTARQEERQITDETVQVCFGIPAAHFQVGGRAFRQPGEFTSREKLDLATFGFIARVKDENTNTEETALETWQIRNYSSTGFLCMLRDKDYRGRISHNQLLAVRRKGNKQYHLGMVQWLRIDENDQVNCGVRFFPGVPKAVAVRPSNFSAAGSDRYERALLLPETAAPSVPPTLILPAGWFQSGRFVEMLSDRKQVVKLLNLLEKCGEFDRCTIAVI